MVNMINLIINLKKGLWFIALVHIEYMGKKSKKHYTEHFVVLYGAFGYATQSILRFARACLYSVDMSMAASALNKLAIKQMRVCIP